MNSGLPKRPSPSRQACLPSKRAKSLRACFACRKQKCKCEYRFGKSVFAGALVGHLFPPITTDDTPLTHAVDTDDYAYNLGHDHVCQRCRAMNLTCVFDSEEETAALLSLDQERDSDQNSQRPSSAEDHRRSIANRNDASSNQTYRDLSARVVALEATVATLLVRQGLPSGPSTSPEQSVPHFSDSAASTIGSTTSTSPCTSTAGGYIEDSGLATRVSHLEHGVKLAHISTDFLTQGLSIDGTVSSKLSEDLFQIFRDLYQPWLSFSVPLPPQSALLLSTVYILASRHISHQTTSIFEDLLPTFQSRLLTCFLANPGALSVETIQALSILSLWLPFTTDELPSIAGGSSADSIPHLWEAQCSLQALARNMARSLGLDRAVVVLKQASVFGIEIEEEERQRLLGKARLHYTLCAQQTECNIHTTISSTPFPSPFPEVPLSLILGIPDASNGPSSRDALFIYRGTLFQIAASGIDVPGPSAFTPSNGPQWLDALTRHSETFISRMDAWETDYSTFMASAPGPCSIRFPFLLWSCDFYRLKVLSRLISTCQTGDVFDFIPTVDVHLHAPRVSYPAHWAHLAIQSAKRFLGRFMEAGQRGWDVVGESDGQVSEEDEARRIRRESTAAPNQVWYFVVDAMKMLVDLQVATDGTRAGFGGSEFPPETVTEDNPGAMARLYEETDGLLAGMVGLLKKMHETISTSCNRHPHVSTRCVELAESVVMGWRTRMDTHGIGWKVDHMGWSGVNATQGFRYGLQLGSTPPPSIASSSEFSAPNVPVGSSLYEALDTVSGSPPPPSYFTHSDEIHLPHRHFNSGPFTAVMNYSLPHPHPSTNTEFRAHSVPALLDASRIGAWQGSSSFVSPNASDSLERGSMTRHGPGTQCWQGHG